MTSETVFCSEIIVKQTLVHRQGVIVPPLFRSVDFLKHLKGAKEEQLRWESGKGSSASEAASSDLIPSRVKPMTSKLVFTASLLDAQHLRNNLDKIFVYLHKIFVYLLEKELRGIIPSQSSR